MRLVCCNEPQAVFSNMSDKELVTAIENDFPNCEVRLL